MSTYRFAIGQVVKVVKGPRAGEVATIAGYGAWCCGIETCPGPCDHAGRPAYFLSLKSLYCPSKNIGAVPEWLIPFHEPGDHASLAELLRSIKGVPAKEKV